jgi:DNA topoisomerase-1
MEKVGRVELAPEESDQQCEKCGRTMVYKYGRFGKFLACPGYPECKNTKPLRKELNITCPKCVEGKILERKTKKGRLFYGCNQYPNCDFASWERPYKEPCPSCGCMTVAKGAKGEKQVITCLNEKCKHTYSVESASQEVES